MTEKDEQYELLHNNLKSTHLLELTAEKEEYYAEVQRLRQLLKDKFAALTVGKGPAGRLAVNVNENPNNSNYPSNAKLTGSNSKQRMLSPYVNTHLQGSTEDAMLDAVPGPFSQRNREKAVASQAPPSRPRSGGPSRNSSNHITSNRRPQSAGGSSAKKPTSGDLGSEIAHTNVDREDHPEGYARKSPPWGGYSSSQEAALTPAAAGPSGDRRAGGRGAYSSEPKDSPSSRGAVSAGAGAGSRGSYPELLGEEEEEEEGDVEDVFVSDLESGKAVYLSNTLQLQQSQTQQAQAQGNPPPTAGAGANPTTGMPPVESHLRAVEADMTPVRAVGLSTPPAESVPLALPLFKLQDRVEGQFKGGAKWYAGKIFKLFPPSAGTSAPIDGVIATPRCTEYTYGIRYDDGDEEQRVPAERVRPLEVKPLGPGKDTPTAKSTPQKQQSGNSVETPTAREPTAAPQAAAPAPTASTVTPSKPSFEQGVLCIQSVSATITELREYDTPDIYVRCSIGSWRRDTRVIDNCQQHVATVFDYLDFQYEVSAAALQFEPMSVQVWDKNKMMKDTLLGEADVPLLMCYIHVGEVVNITAEIKNKKGKVSGHVVLSVCAKTVPGVAGSSTQAAGNAAGKEVVKESPIDFMNYMAELSDTNDEKEGVGKASKFQPTLKKIVSKRNVADDPKGSLNSTTVTRAELRSGADYDDDDFDP